MAPYPPLLPYICPCIHPFFLLYRIQGHFDYRAIVLPKMHIVHWGETTLVNPQFRKPCTISDTFFFYLAGIGDCIEAEVAVPEVAVIPAGWEGGSHRSSLFLRILEGMSKIIVCSFLFLSKFHFSTEECFWSYWTIVIFRPLKVEVHRSTVSTDGLHSKFIIEQDS